MWINGPFPAGSNDISIFRKKCLLEELSRRGKKAIGDSGYNGGPQYLSTPNAHDNKAVKLFKSRALKRHETFNGHTKVFEILSGRFRNSPSRLCQTFEAVCVVRQYKIEHEHPLFNILIEYVVDRL